MPNNFEYQDYRTVTPGAIPAGTVIRTTQNSDGSHTQHIAIEENGIVSSLNSSVTPLSGGASFQGTYESTLDYSSITVSVHSNVASAASGFKVYFSKDGITGFVSDEYTIPANTCKTYSFQTVAPYFKLVYTNGASAQASFTLCTVYKKIAGIASSHRIGDLITNDDDAQLVKAVFGHYY